MMLVRLQRSCNCVYAVLGAQIRHVRSKGLLRTSSRRIVLKHVSILRVQVYIIHNPC
jgi:hypothetical protein